MTRLFRLRPALAGLLALCTALSTVPAAHADHGEREYLPFGHHVRMLPESARLVPFGGVHYRFHNGYWYAPGSDGFVVVQPPLGIWVGTLPAFATVLTVGALTYWVVNDVYYRPVSSGGYKVVAPPVQPSQSPMPHSGQDRVFIYPTQGQSTEKQASDEYECHRWAVTQSGYDPAASATSEPADASKKNDYRHAQAACLEGRGYTVR